MEHVQHPPKPTSVLRSQPRGREAHVNAKARVYYGFSTNSRCGLRRDIYGSVYSKQVSHRSLLPDVPALTDAMLSSQSSGDEACRPSSDSSAGSNTPIGLIVGVAVAGFIALLAIALLGYLYYLYRKNRLNFAGRRAPSPSPHMAPAHPAGGGYHATPFVPPSAIQYPNYAPQTPTTMGMSVPATGYYNSSDFHRATSPEATSSSEVRPNTICLVPATDAYLPISHLSLGCL